jgi:hypothetical protein
MAKLVRRVKLIAELEPGVVSETEVVRIVMAAKLLGSGWPARQPHARKRPIRMPTSPNTERKVAGK